jgi:hypothetical protein
VDGGDLRLGGGNSAQTPLGPIRPSCDLNADRAMGDCSPAQFILGAGVSRGRGVSWSGTTQEGQRTLASLYTVASDLRPHGAVS